MTTSTQTAPLAWRELTKLAADHPISADLSRWRLADLLNDLRASTADEGPTALVSALLSGQVYETIRELTGQDSAADVLNHLFRTVPTATVVWLAGAYLRQDHVHGVRRASEEAR